MKRNGLIGLIPAFALLAACNQPAPAPAPAPVPAAPAQSPAEHGKYLVTLGGCDDCHSPKVFKDTGPEPDMTRRLSGHPAADKLPPVPAGLIAPDKTTGLGSWTADMFVKALKTGKHQGEGRPILPPMPWQNFSQLKEEDLRAIFAFLQTLTPIQNAVPDPVPPAGAPPAKK